jgi:hypothetical protein
MGFQQKETIAMPTKTASPIRKDAALAQPQRRGAAPAATRTGVKRTAHDEASLLSKEVARLAEACRSGRLSERVDLAQFTGSHRESSAGINAILDALTAPLGVASDCAARLGRGELPPRIAESYSGDLDGLRQGLNGCIDSLGLLLAEMKHMSEEHQRGDIDVVIPAGKFHGAYRTIAEGVNDMVKALNYSSYAEYCNYLFGIHGQREEIGRLIDVVTTNKTDFFREPAHFDYLLERALPEMIADNEFGRPLLIWSAGCSTGEEP